MIECDEQPKKIWIQRIPESWTCEPQFWREKVGYWMQGKTLKNFDFKGDPESWTCEPQF